MSIYNAFWLCVCVCVCVCRTVWLGDMLLDERLVVSYNVYKADIETGVKARGFDSCGRWYMDTCSERVETQRLALCRNVRKCEVYAL